MAIIMVYRAGPRREQAANEAPQRGKQVRLAVRRRDVQPPAVLVLRHGIQARLADEKAEARCSGGRKHEARDSSQGAVADGDERGLLLALLALPDGLEGADVAGHEGEDDVSNASLD